ncbi:polysaccharide deacetylase family protein [uncultured Clostridium sp.]|uniref:polysaccharide deacetylase family protein n=1 Tax=uncultured Clostridium sp. TaxID=59620 RepID=UPI0028EAD46E|nr:polysaccharide deacetylase family protein [uncultured Clostridium sp.]
MYIWKKGLKRKKLHFIILILLMMSILLTSCNKDKNKVDTKNPDFNEYNSYVLDENIDEENILGLVQSADKSKLKTIYKVNTISKSIALTFEGMADKDTMNKILDLLDKYNVKSTFFLPGIRVAEEPDIAMSIIKRGHDIGNNTLNRKSKLDNLDIKEIYKEIAISNQIIEKETKVKTNLLRVKGANYTDDILKAAAVDGYVAAVGYNFNMQTTSKSNSEIKKYFSSHINRGDIVTIDTNKEDAIDLTEFVLKEALGQGCSILSVNELLKKEYKIDKSVFSASENIGKNKGVFSYAYTTKKAVALTFEGMGDKTMMNGILNALDENHIKATFFLPGLAVSDHTELAKEILKRGHEIESNSLEKKDLTQLDYNKVSEQIYITDKIFKDKLGISPRYLRPTFGSTNDTVCKAADALGYTVVTYSKNSKDSDMKSAKEIEEYMKKKITRGEIITLNAAVNPAVIEAIPLIAKHVRYTGYDFVTIDELYKSQYERKPLEQIPGFNAASVKLNNNGIEKQLIHVLPKSAGKTVSLTFDDWASDRTITAVLDILKANGIKASFFIRGKGAEANPNLLMAIAKDGHDIANHTYSHTTTGEQSIKELQEDIIKCHQVLTYAIQRQPEMFFRPPQFEIDEKRAAAIQASGYKNVIMSDLSPHDWNTEKSSKEVLDDIFNRVEDGSIITLHILDDSSVLEVLQPTIDELRRRGYSFAKISDYIK